MRSVLRVAAVLLALVAILGGKGTEGAIPNFLLKNPEGGEYSSEEWLGRNVGVIVFVRWNHIYSEHVLKALQDIHTDEPNVHIVAIYSGDVSREDVRKTIQELGVEFSVALDPDRTLKAQFMAIAAPSAAFIDKEGRQRFFYAGYRRDFAQKSRAHLALLQEKITEEEHDSITSDGKNAYPVSNEAMTQYRLGLQMVQRGMRDAARENFTKAWDADRTLVAAAVELGYMLLEDGASEAALGVFEQAAEAAPRNLKVAGAKAVALLRSGKTDEGKRLLEEVLAKGVEDPLLHYEMGQLHENAGASAEALRSYKAGLELALQKSQDKQKPTNHPPKE